MCPLERERWGWRGGRGRGWREGEEGEVVVGEGEVRGEGRWREGECSRLMHYRSTILYVTTH